MTQVTEKRPQIADFITTDDIKVIAENTGYSQITVRQVVWYGYRQNKSIADYAEKVVQARLKMRVDIAKKDLAEFESVISGK